ncbi:MAG: cupin domain-containing protein [Dehalococcoidia bacterium]|nr:cupin domain-containing protein [Dehalococcoidia bacterium]
MVERVIERGREPEPEETLSAYTFRFFEQKAKTLREGVVVIKGKDVRWEQNRQAVIKPYIMPGNWAKLGSPEWTIFINHIKTHSGKHVHQGGLGIFVLEGRGYTVIDGERFDWEKDDLIILPVKPGGCEHQHFNLDQNKAAEWMAIIFVPFRMASGNEPRQKSFSPTYDGTEKFVDIPNQHVT